MSEPLLEINAKGEAVGRLQELLDRAGFLQPGDTFTVFGPGTRNAVIAYQTTRGLLADGKVGDNTWNALKSGAPAVAPAPAQPTPHHESLLVEIGLTAEARFGLSVHQCDAPGAPARWGPVSPGHSATSLHFKGRAFDAAGTAAQMREFTQWAIDNHGPRLEELIHNPNGSIDGGVAQDPGFWGPGVFDDHRNHVHLAV
ncbi:MAG TPA: peptidoglycan-binding domain-containing protein [Acidimicrobiales bacterium]